jgi:hypothetical protein
MIDKRALELGESEFWGHVKQLRHDGTIPYVDYDSLADLGAYVPVSWDYWTHHQTSITRDEWAEFQTYIDAQLKHWAEQRRIDRLAGKFQTDGTGDEEYQAVAFGARWNGWATPIVTREVFQAFVDQAGNHGEYCALQFYGVAAVFTELEAMGSDQYVHYITPISKGPHAGAYDLGVLGWCFYRTDDFSE